MKRCLFKLALFLFLGAIINVAIAWGFAIKGRISAGSSNQYLSHTTQPRWLVGVTSGTGVTRISVTPNNEMWGERSPTYLPEMIPYWSVTRYRPESNVFDDPLGPWTLEYAYGWPLRSGLSIVRKNVEESPGVRNRDNTFAIVTGIKVFEEPPGEPLPYKMLPIRPIIPGFVANMLLYAATLWLLLVAPWQLRRTIRRKRGLCIQCGYDLRGTDHIVCPECGTKLSPPFSPG
ncbi:MAG: hypothetical protein IH984_09580 [Planctomycetes bacterium]|nr:hypothetical protein [Planctomycetota bacterium]